MYLQVKEFRCGQKRSWDYFLVYILFFVEGHIAYQRMSSKKNAIKFPKKKKSSKNK